MKDARDRKLALVRGDVVIWGVDIGHNRHWGRAVRPDATAASKALAFNNRRRDFRMFKEEIARVLQREGASRAVVAMEPTGPYWKPLAQYLRDEGITVVLVNPAHVKHEKERSDNTPSKSDRKDCRIIAELAQRGDWLHAIVPGGIYADLRELTAARWEEKQRRNAAVNRLKGWLAERFPEFEDVFKNPLGKAARWVLDHCPLPAEVLAYRLDDLAEAFKAAASGRVGQKRAFALLLAASDSVGVREGGDATKERLRGYLEAADASTARLEILERKMETALEQTGLKELLLGIPGVGAVTAAAVLGETGDLRVFRTANQVQKLAGFNLTENQSGEHRGRSTISKRGRPGLRRVLVQAALCVIVHAPEFRARYEALKTRSDKPLNKMQALVAAAMQVLRVMFRIARTGKTYDPKKVGGHQLLAAAA